MLKLLIKRSKTTTLKAKSMPKRKAVRRSPSRRLTTTPSRSSMYTRRVACLVSPATTMLPSKSPSCKR